MFFTNPNSELRSNLDAMRGKKRRTVHVGLVFSLSLILISLSFVVNVSSAYSGLTSTRLAEPLLVETPETHFPITLKSPMPQVGGSFGLSVGLSGGLSVVGAPEESADGYSNAGNAYVYNSTTGALLDKLSSPEPQREGDFGFAVALSGYLAIVGAPGESADGYPQAGYTYVFNAMTGSLIQNLSSPNAQLNGGFGGAVAIYSNLAIVGAYNENASGFSEAGRAYVFNALSGALITTLTSPKAQTGGGFGVGVGIDNKLAIIGAVGESVNGQRFAGRAYVFNSATGSLVHSFVSPKAQANGWFGASVDVGGSVAIISAPLETAKGYSEAGNTYLFNVTSGNLIKSLADPKTQRNGEFGGFVATNGKFAVVGAVGEIVDGYSSAGITYLFTAEAGSLVRAFTSPNPNENGIFGGALAISGDLFIVGAWGESVGNYSQAGHAYIFRD